MRGILKLFFTAVTVATVAAVVVFLSGCPARAGESFVGRTITVNMACMTEADAKILSKAAAEGGKRAALEVLDDKDVACGKLTGPVTAIVTKELWRVTTAENMELVFVEVMAPTGDKAITVIALPGERS